MKIMLFLLFASLLQLDTFKDGIMQADTMDDILKLSIFGLLLIVVYLERKTSTLVKDHKKTLNDHRAEIDKLTEKMERAYKEAFEVQEKYAEKLEELIQSQAMETKDLANMLTIHINNLHNDVKTLKRQ